jgi:hypothetical protein
MVFLAKAADKLAGRVKHGNGVHGRGCVRAVFDIDQSTGINGHAMRFAPDDVAGDFAPLVIAFIGMLAAANARGLGAGFVFRVQDQR